MTDSAAQVTPGWYHATGDPPGTQRYWDGTQWRGDAQMMGTTAPERRDATGSSPTPHGPRLLAGLIDHGVLLLLLFLAAGAGVIIDIYSPFDGLHHRVRILTLGFPLYSVMAGLALLAGWTYNWVYLQGTTGQTIGKKFNGVKLVSAQTGQPIGAGMAVIRLAVRVVLYLLSCGLAGPVGAIIILLDADRQRLTDKALKWRVVPA